MIGKSIFLDTSFIVATQVIYHPFFKRATELRTGFLEKGFRLYTSLLTLDEFWYVLIGLWQASESHLDKGLLYSQLKNATSNILNFENIFILETNQNGTEILKIVDTMHKYKMRPRDSIIISMMKKAGIENIASFDRDFDKVPGIKRLS